MPAKRKPEGTQPRTNGAANRMDLAVVTPITSRVEVPPFPLETGSEEARSLWHELFSEPQAAAIIGAQLVVAQRWIRAYDAWLTAAQVVDLEPMVQGSQGQPRPNPMMSWVISREVEMEKCETQLGIGLRNRADLGVSAAMAKLTAQQVNQMAKKDGAGHAPAGKAVGAGKAGRDPILEGWASE